MAHRRAAGPATAPKRGVVGPLGSRKTLVGAPHGRSAPIVVAVPPNATRWWPVGAVWQNSPVLGGARPHSGGLGGARAHLGVLSRNWLHSAVCGDAWAYASARSAQLGRAGLARACSGVFGSNRVVRPCDDETPTLLRLLPPPARVGARHPSKQAPHPQPFRAVRDKGTQRLGPHRGSRSVCVGAGGVIARAAFARAARAGFCF